MIKKYFKKIYGKVPYKKQLFLIVKHFFKPSKSLYQHLYFNDVFSVHMSEKCSFLLNHFGAKVENEIFWEGIFGSWEKESLKLWSKLCRDLNYIFDVGANSGVYSLMAKSLNIRSNVYAFEPIERVFNRLVYNNEINHYDISAFNIGLSNYNGEAFFYDPETEHVYSIIINETIETYQNKDFKRKKVNVNCFDTWFIENNILGFDLIKIDVETYEPEVIEGMMNSIIRFRPLVIIEVLNDEIANKLNNLFKELNYQYYDINESNGVKKIHTILKSSSYNLFLCPNEKEYQLVEHGIL